MDTSFGIQQKGKRNLITDVAGITVGHCTLADGDVQTGVTALLPHQGDLFHDRCPAAVHVINGFGKSAGLVQVQELGYLETPLILTNTLSVGTAFTACVRYMLARNDQIGRAESTVNPVILECNDGYLNDIRGLHVTEDHVFAALDAADTAFALGAVGAGRGMSCYHLKGGIGSASRVFEIGGQTYTLGALAMTNFGSLIDLTIAGERIGKKLAAEPEDAKGSCIMVLATDAPLSSRQLSRVARRAQSGLARTIDWDDPAAAVPGFMTVAFMPLTYNISYGIAFGLISYVFIKIFTGKIKEINVGTWVITILFALMFFLTR